MELNKDLEYPYNLFEVLNRKDISKEELDGALEMIHPRELTVILLRYESEFTYQMISKEYNVTVERIRQIEKKALRHLDNYTLQVRINKMLPDGYKAIIQRVDRKECPDEDQN